MSLNEGQLIGGRYLLVRKIATGGMGQVFEAQDQELENRVCALKILRDEYVGDEAFLKRFRAEANHTAALVDDNVAGLYDYGEVDGRAYLVMELAPGRPLSEIIEEHPDGLDEDNAVHIMRQIASALGAAHTAGVVHRDVKPENVLVDEANDHHVKITDFGIARSEDQAKLTKTGLVMGTAQYLSPEQAMGKPATNLSDIYALGILGYEMVTGHRPFTGASQVEIAMAQVKKRVPPMPEDIDRELRKLIEMCLAKSPANRPRSAEAVVRALDAISKGETPRYETSAVVPGLSRRQPLAKTARAATSETSVAETTPSETSNPHRSRSHSRTQTAAMPNINAATAGTSAAPTRHIAAAANPNDANLSTNIATTPRTGNRGAKRRAAEARNQSAPAVVSTSTGKRFGSMTLPGIVLIVLLVILVIAGLAIYNSQHSASAVASLLLLGWPDKKSISVPRSSTETITIDARSEIFENGNAK